MPAENENPVVLDSIQSAEGDRCIDIFRRPDKSIGFEEWRRDPEAGRWFAIGGFAGNICESVETARSAAATHVPWFDESEGNPS